MVKALSETNAANEVAALKLEKQFAGYNCASDEYY
jgi:hypothetical protein